MHKDLPPVPAHFKDVEHYEEFREAWWTAYTDAKLRYYMLSEPLGQLCKRSIEVLTLLGPTIQFDKLLRAWNSLPRSQRSHATFCEIARAYEEITVKHTRRVFRDLARSSAELFSPAFQDAVLGGTAGAKETPASD